MIEVKADSKVVSVNISGDLAEDELRELIHSLCNARKQIAEDPTTPESSVVKATALGRWYTALTDNGHTLLAMLVPGFGWAGITLSAPDRVLIAHFLAGQQYNAMVAGATTTATSHVMSGGGQVH